MDTLNLAFQQEVTLAHDPAFRGLYEGPMARRHREHGLMVLLTITAPGATGHNRLSIKQFPLAQVEPVASPMRGGVAVLRTRRQEVQP